MNRTTQSRQRGGAAVIVIGILVGLVLLFGGAFAVYTSIVGQGVEMEAALKATKTNNENILASYGQKVTEAAQVTGMARDDLATLTREAIGGRYGDKGSAAVLQMIREQNPQLDPALYRNLQQIIEGGRNEFKVAQTRLTDQVRAYEEMLGYVVKGGLLRFAGFPKVKLEDFKPVTTERARDAFQTGIEKPLELRPRDR